MVKKYFLEKSMVKKYFLEKSMVKKYFFRKKTNIKKALYTFLNSLFLLKLLSKQFIFDKTSF